MTDTDASVTLVTEKQERNGYYDALDGRTKLIKKCIKQCDAEMIIKTIDGEYKAGVEIELTSKSFKRLVGAVQSIDANREDLNAVLWIALYGTIIKNLQSAIKAQLPHLRYPRRHLFILWNDFTSQQMAATWTNVYGQKMKLFVNEEVL